MLIIQTTSDFKPEKEYAFQVLLREILGLEYAVDYQDVSAHSLQLPNGKTLEFPDLFKPVYTSPPPDLRPPLTVYREPSTVHRAPSTVDPFAFSFYLLSRLEEFKSDSRDTHGRFPAEQSQAWQQGFLDRPVVNEWADWLWELLVQQGWTGARKRRKFQLSISCDVDHPMLWWTGMDRLKTLVGAILKRGDWQESAYWLRHHTFQKKDPYDVFDEWLALFEQNGIRAQFNFMGKRPQSSDCWYPLEHPFVKQLMHKLAKNGHSIGFHPSYEAFEDENLFVSELASLRAIAPLDITAGRQHYLRFSNPKTWQMWENAGLLEDSTLGYPEQEGFRCGICHDFPVFDLEKRKTLRLREKPLIAMDVTLAQYQKYTPDEAIGNLNQLRQTVEKHGGDFTLLWHNSSWNTPFWENWKKVFRSFMEKTLIFCLLWRLVPAFVQAQTTGIPLHAPAYPILDRLEIISGLESPLHPELKFSNRREAVEFALSLDSLINKRLSSRDRQDIQYLLDDSNEWLPDTSKYLRKTKGKVLLKYFYQTPANFFEVNTPAFKLRANPMLNFQLGKEKAVQDNIYENQRGIEVRGAVDQKLFFYTNLIESQARYPEYVAQRVAETQAVPGAGFFKPYRSGGYDFNVATAYLGFQATRHFGIQLGHGRHFIGNGYRSMLLSDFGAPTFFLKLDTRVWHFHYQNLFLELSPVSQVSIPDGTILPKKYAAIHYLNYKVTPRLAFGFFEATVFNRSRQFELQYLNPVIFYRTVEGMIGSPDNVLLGFDGRWNLFKRFQLYGQLMLDELVASEVFSRSGWWANKWGLQAGAKYINAFGLDHLDLQVEHNRARPYTYSHTDPANSYTHYNQTLAHPLGANFAETLILVRWQPLSRLSIRARYIQAKTGDNTATENWGQNPLLSYDTRVQDYGNEIGQGLAADIRLFGLDLSWALWHHIFLDLKYLYRVKDSADQGRDASSKVFSAGIRMNLWNSSLDF